MYLQRNYIGVCNFVPSKQWRDESTEMCPSELASKTKQRHISTECIIASNALHKRIVWNGFILRMHRLIQAHIYMVFSKLGFRDGLAKISDHYPQRDFVIRWSRVNSISRPDIRRVIFCFYPSCTKIFLKRILLNLDKKSKYFGSQIM